MSARRPSRAALFILLIVAILVGATAIWLLTQPKPVPAPKAVLALRAVAFADLDDWASTDPRGARDAFQRSCAHLLALPPSTALSGTGYGGVTGDWSATCRQVPQTADAKALRHWFEANFVPFAVGRGETAEGLFTGYYEPELNGARTAHGGYRTPVYGRPDDLIDVDLGAFRDALRGEKIAGRIEGHRLVPYATRAEIDRDGLPHAPVLFFADDPAAVFFLQLQPAGRIRFENGLVERVAYDGQNGQPYTAIGRVLLQQGQLERSKVSMQAIHAWMDSHPRDARRLMEEDKSFVFFRELPLGDPNVGGSGAEGVPLTPESSIAVDDRFHPLGAPFYIVAQAPDADASRPDRPLRQLFVAQDVGGAIRGPVRADVFFGDGRDAASKAGRMKSRGIMYVLLPHALAKRVGEAPS